MYMLKSRKSKEKYIHGTIIIIIIIIILLLLLLLVDRIVGLVDSMSDY